MTDFVEIYSKTIAQYEHEQLRLTISEFRGVEYLNIRKYYMGFEGEWLPTTEGISIAIDFDNCRKLFEGMAEILSLAESREILEKNFGDLIQDIYQK